MSENQAPYGKVSTEALTEIFTHPAGWEMAKQAIHNAAAIAVEQQKCSICAAVAILDASSAVEASKPYSIH